MTNRAPSDCEGFYRRDFLTVGAASVLGLCARRRSPTRGAAAGSPPSAQSVILIWLAGGPATIDMWDLKPEAPDVIRGEFRPIATRVPGTRICELLPRVAGVMDRCALVRSLHHSIPAHGPGTVLMTTGHAPAAAGVSRAGSAWPRACYRPIPAFPPTCCSTTPA